MASSPRSFRIPATSLLSLNPHTVLPVLQVSFPVASSLDSLKPGQRTKDMDFIDQLLTAINK